MASNKHGTSHLRVWQRHIPPIDQVRVKCSVCGQWNDPDRTQSPDETPTVYQTTGTTYFAKTASGELDLVNINLAVEGKVPAYAGCWFCGSPRWQDGSAGPLKGLP